MEDWHNFGADYDTTLMAWHRVFLSLAGDCRQLFRTIQTDVQLLSERLRGRFRARDIQLWQVVFSRGIEHGLRVAR
jgi:cyclopropane-fatty-acyl-phospholipid synthase